MSGLIDGVAQFFTPTHMLAVGALALLLGQLPAHLRAIAVAAFVFGLVIGSIAIAAALRETPPRSRCSALRPSQESLSCWHHRFPPFVSYALVFVVGTALALNSPPQATAISSAVAAQFGTGIAALATLSLGALIAGKAIRSWQRIAMRILASWIAASAILVLALRLARGT
jgi:hypothetical protein